MKNKKKQYVIKMAYTDNYHVLQYVDGSLKHIISYLIMNWMDILLP